MYLFMTIVIFMIILVLIWNTIQVFKQEKEMKKRKDDKNIEWKNGHIILVDKEYQNEIKDF